MADEAVNTTAESLAEEPQATPPPEPTPPAVAETPDFLVRPEMARPEPAPVPRREPPPEPYYDQRPRYERPPEPPRRETRPRPTFTEDDLVDHRSFQRKMEDLDAWREEQIRSQYDDRLTAYEARQRDVAAAMLALHEENQKRGTSVPPVVVEWQMESIRGTVKENYETTIAKDPAMLDKTVYEDYKYWLKGVLADAEERARNGDMSGMIALRKPKALMRGALEMIKDDHNWTPGTGVVAPGVMSLGKAPSQTATPNENVDLDDEEVEFFRKGGIENPRAEIARGMQRARKA
jgi:hypothetical protein